MIVRESTLADFYSIDLQESQKHLSRFFPQAIEDVLVRCNSLTILNDNGACMALAGVTEKDKETAVVWVLLAGWAGRHMFGLTKLLKKLMAANTEGYRQIETVVYSDFKAGHRWARLFGFELLQKEYIHDAAGRPEDLYRRVL